MEYAITCGPIILLSLANRAAGTKHRLMILQQVNLKKKGKLAIMGVMMSAHITSPPLKTSTGMMELVKLGAMNMTTRTTIGKLTKMVTTRT